jgi:uncharacterized membrane-anchored protein
VKGFASGVVLLFLAGCSPFVYHSPEATAELRGAMQAANDARIDGPARVPLAGRTTLFVQSGLVFIPRGQAERLLRAIGARPTKEMLGMLVCATDSRTDMAVLYTTSKPGAALPELDIASWREAPALAAFRPR